MDVFVMYSFQSVIELHLQFQQDKRKQTAKKININPIEIL